LGRFTSGVARLLRETFAHEVLPPSPPREPPLKATPGRLSRLLAPEPLPPAPAHGSSTEATRRRGLVVFLFGPEPLPPDLPPAPRRKVRWLAWLFSPENLEP